MSAASNFLENKLLDYLFRGQEFGVHSPTLDFNFVNTNQLDPRITFTRASTATYFDSTGTLRTSPMNLLLDSDNLAAGNRGSNTGWYAITRASISTNVVTSPDGTQAADKIVEDTANGTHYASSRTTAGSTTNTNPLTVSAYFKAAERSTTSILLTEGTTYSRNALVFFDLSAGTATTPTTAGGASAASATITAVGNGWYRCTLTVTLGGTDTQVEARFYPTTSTTSATYTGNGTSGIYIWGAQLEQGSSATAYIPTTAASSGGARFDYDPVTLQSKGLLIEEQRTNSIRNNTMQGAVAGTPGTLPTNWTVSGFAGLTREIVGVGLVNGVNYIDVRYSGTTSGVFGDLYFDGSNNIAAANGQVWTQSVWVQVVAGSLANVSSINLSALQYDITPTSLGATTNGAASASVSTTFQRITRNHTTNNASTAYIRPYISLGLTSGAAVDITLRIGLPQLEQGALATSVIPTTTTALTRSADAASVTGTNFSSWYNATAGTIYAELMRTSLIASGGFANAWAISDNTANERLIAYNTGTGATMDVGVTDGGVSQATLLATGPITANTTIKTAFAYAVNDFAWVRDAGTVQTDTSGTLPTVDRLYIGSNQIGGGQWTGYLRRITYYPFRLPNETLQNITNSNVQYTGLQPLSRGPSTVYIALFTNSADDSSTNVEPVGGNYSRVAVNCSLINWSGTQGSSTTTQSTGTSGTISNNIPIQFNVPSANWGTIKGFGIYDSSTGGNLLFQSHLANWKDINYDPASPGPVFEAGSLSITFS